MAATTVKQLVESQTLSASAASALYQAPTSTVASIQGATLLNTTGGVVACSVYITPQSTAPATQYQLVSINIAAGKSYLCPELVNQKVSAGHEIHALGNGVTFAVGGVEVAGQ